MSQRTSTTPPRTAPSAPSAPPAPSARGGFGALFWAQLLGAFNDNLFKNALVVALVYGGLDGQASQPLVAAAGGVFILPFFLFSALGGQLADKLPKDQLIRWVKAAEVVVMALGGLSFALGSVPCAFVTLFCMGAQSALFGPLKYAALPELLPREQLVRGNARVEMGTFLAILAGTLAGGALMGWGGRFGVSAAAQGAAHGGAPWRALWVPALAMTVAAAGYVAARRVPALPARAPELRVERGVLRPTWRLVRRGTRARPLRLTVLALSWFWLVGSVVLSLLPTLTQSLLGGDESTMTCLLVAFSVGVGAGSVLCERISARRSALGWVPLAALGGAVALLDAAWVTHGLALATSEAGWGEVLARGSGLRLLVDWSVLALTSGLFTVPLYAALQLESAEHERARVVAANNVVNAAFMVAGAGALAAAGVAAERLGVSKSALVAGVFATLAVGQLIVAVLAYRELAAPLYHVACGALTRLRYRLDVGGAEQIPRQGGAVLVCNHVTFVDWLIIAAVSPRPVRFVMHRDFTRLPGVQGLLRRARVIPIASATEDRVVMERAFAEIRCALESGELVCLFPEGQLTRDGSLGPFRRGIERVIDTTPVPVVPLHLGGLWASWLSRAPRKRGLWRRRVTVRVGVALTPERVSAAALRAAVAAQAPGQ